MSRLQIPTDTLQHVQLQLTAVAPKLHRTAAGTDQSLGTLNAPTDAGRMALDAGRLALTTARSTINALGSRAKAILKAATAGYVV